VKLFVDFHERRQLSVDQRLWSLLRSNAADRDGEHGQEGENFHAQAIAVMPGEVDAFLFSRFPNWLFRFS
jgi:hypothetical protein